MAARATRQKDLEFHVSSGERTEVFKTFSEAAAYAVVQSVSRGREAVIDVVTWSRAAAKAWGGSYAVEVYDEDPEASVHERIRVRADSQGRIA